eukprot:s331_g2.t1
MRTSGETIPQLLVREEELFVELQRALKRAPDERAKAETKLTGVGGAERGFNESFEATLRYLRNIPRSPLKVASAIQFER